MGQQEWEFAFRDRHEAGQKLAERLRGRVDRDALVLAISAGGVPVAEALARSLGLPLDLLLVGKLSLPWQPEMGVGAMASTGHRVLNHDLLRLLEFQASELEQLCQALEGELARLEALYRDNRPLPDLRGRQVVLADDGLFTGCTARAALEVARQRGAERLVLAVPAAPPEVLAALASEAELCCLESPWLFLTLASFYEDFRPPGEDQVRRLLAASLACAEG